MQQIKINNITFENENGEKVRLSNLQKTFSDEKYSREGLAKEFDLVKRKPQSRKRYKKLKKIELKKHLKKN